MQQGAASASCLDFPMWLFEACPVIPLGPVTLINLPVSVSRVACCCTMAHHLAPCAPLHGCAFNKVTIQVKQVDSIVTKIPAEKRPEPHDLPGEFYQSFSKNSNTNPSQSLP